MRNKHLSFDDRLEIEKGLKEGLSFKAIAKSIEKDYTTISKEIRNHITFKDSGAIGRPFQDCFYRKNCEYREKGTKCNQKNCNHYTKESCLKLNKPPYVCNGCNKKSVCTLSKKLYDSSYAQNEYKDNLSDSRQGITFSKDEIKYLNDLLKPLIIKQGQSIHHAYINNRNKIMCSEKEIYRLVDSGILEIRNIDLPRKVRFRARKNSITNYKIDKNCLENRRYEDFLKYIEKNPDTPIVEIDSVEGIKGGKALLTIHFVNTSFMFAFLREHNDAQSVIDIFNSICDAVGLDKFMELFMVILTDNGSEFSNPLEIEIDPNTGEQRTQIFYCHPSSPYEKGSCEVNHELLRRILPKGTSFDSLTQEDMNLIMSHINSYKRKKLNDCSPFQLFSLMYGSDTAIKLGIKEINPNNINLTSDLIKKD